LADHVTDAVVTGLAIIDTGPFPSEKGKQESEMRRLVLIAALLLSFGIAPLAVAQSEAYVPALAEIMSAAQWRHIKLWFAGKHENWKLASYELRQVRASLEDAATYYSGVCKCHGRADPSDRCGDRGKGQCSLREGF
jgi:hypothetical protein